MTGTARWRNTMTKGHNDDRTGWNLVDGAQGANPTITVDDAMTSHQRLSNFDCHLNRQWWGTLFFFFFLVKSILLLGIYDGTTPTIMVDDDCGNYDCHLTRRRWRNFFSTLLCYLINLFLSLDIYIGTMPTITVDDTMTSHQRLRQLWLPPHQAMVRNFFFFFFC
jgi:hypothetical protein